MKRIRNWLARAETCRRHFVVAEVPQADPVRAADVRHGVLAMVGRGEPKAAGRKVA